MNAMETPELIASDADLEGAVAAIDGRKIGLAISDRLIGCALDLGNPELPN